MEGRRIALTQGYSTIVSPDDYEWLSQHRWCVALRRGVPYAKRGGNTGGRHRTIHMHRAILNAPPGMEVDHINHDTLDNRRDNLRLATRSQNRTNSLKILRNTSGFIGVSRRFNGWIARFNDIHIGMYDTAEDAARAYDAVVSKERGEFAVLNFPGDTIVVTPTKGSPYRSNTSGYTGVTFHQRLQKWQARIRIAAGQRAHVGYFDTPYEAHEAINEALERH